MTQENDELIMVGGDSIRQSEIEEEPHKHDFDLDVKDIENVGGTIMTIQATCECGRVVSWTEIETILNLSVD